jgi:hypothetical protein
MKNNERATVNFDKMLLPELKAEAKSRKVKGFSTMKKAELVSALKATEAQVKPAESFIDGLKAAFAVEREARSNKGREAGKGGTVTLKTRPEDKVLAYRLQRGSQTAKLSAKQSKRVRKAEAKLYDRKRVDGFSCSGMDTTNLFTYA